MAQASEGIVAAQTAPRWPRALLLVAAAIEFLGGLSDLPILFGDLSQIPGPGLGGAVIVARIVLQPILALAALVFAFRGRMCAALLAMAAMLLATWASYLPSVAIHGLGLDAGGVTAAVIVYQIILVPILAAAVIALALRGKAPTLATILAVLPTLIGIASVIAFGIGIAIYGF